MSDRKIIFIAIILAIIVIGVAWYYTQYRPPQAAISPSGQESERSFVITETGITIGNPNAPVTIDEYTNFLCPACANFAIETLPIIVSDYVATGKVKYSFFIFPPLELSKAAMCAYEQNKFSEYHDYLFKHQDKITDEEILKDFAGNIGMNIAQFDTCYNSVKYDDKIQKWFEEGQWRDVTATPTFFINDRKFVGAQPYEEFKKIIDEKLDR